MDEIRFAIECREDETRASPGRLTGTLLTYGEQAQDRPELFEPDALRWDAAGIVLNRMHDRKAPIMRVVPQVRDGRVVVDAPLPNTAAGRDAAEEIRSGLFRGLSIEFRAIRQTTANGVRRIGEALLGGAALVDSPAYRAPVEVRKRAQRRRWWL